MIWLVALLEVVKHRVLRDDVWCADSCDSQQFEKQEITKALFIIFSVVREPELPWDDSQGVEDETAVENVALSNQFEFIDDFVVLRVTVGSEEVLNDLDKEDNFRNKYKCVYHLFSFDTKGNQVKVQDYVAKHDDLHDKLKQSYEWTILIQDVTIWQKKTKYD